MTGLKIPGGAKGGGGSKKRVQTDASHAGRMGRVSRAAVREAVKIRGQPLHEKAAMASLDEDEESASWIGWSATAATAATAATTVAASVLAWPMRALTHNGN